MGPRVRRGGLHGDRRKPLARSVGGFLAIRPAATPAISTLASPPVPAGGLISDSATLTGGFAPTGNVTFTLYGPGDATCSNALRSTTVPVGAGGVSHSGDVEVGAAGTYNWVATYSGDLNNLPVSSECGSEPVVITAQTLRGRAYGLSANASLLGLPLINRPPTPDTGEIATTLDSSTSVPCVATLSGPLSAHALCASVTTTAFPAGSTAVASVADLSLSVATLPDHHDRGGEFDLDHELRRVHGGDDDRLPQDRLDGRDRHTDAGGSQYARDRRPGLAGAQRADTRSHRRPHGQRDPPERERRWPGPDEPRRGLGQERYRQLPLTGLGLLIRRLPKLAWYGRRRWMRKLAESI